MHIPDILPLQPHFREAIWGGRGLADFYHKTLPGDKIGESWEVSAYDQMESIVAAGPLSGQTLSQVLLEGGVEAIGQHVADRYGAAFPLLIKFLDARDDLSIQAHPDDAYARAEGLGTYGKMEAWYILRSEGGRIACGSVDGVEKADFERAVHDNRVEEVVRFFNVKAGDVVFVPPGTVHALCRNVMAYEVQQSSDLTFRIWDYNRPGADGHPRELHIDRALDVMMMGGRSPQPTHWTELPGATETGATLVASEHFQLERFSPTGARTHTYPSFSALTVLNGMAELQGATGQYRARAGDTFFIPAKREITVTPRDRAIEYLIASVP